jgi:hypothetical protein
MALTRSVASSSEWQNKSYRPQIALFTVKKATSPVKIGVSFQSIVCNYGLVTPPVFDFSQARIGTLNRRLGSMGRIGFGGSRAAARWLPVGIVDPSTKRSKGVGAKRPMLTARAKSSQVGALHLRHPGSSAGLRGLAAGMPR